MAGNHPTAAAPTADIGGSTRVFLGVALTVQVGTLVPVVKPAITGIGLTLSVGDVAERGLQSVGMTLSVGAIVPTVSKVLTGVAGTMGVGSLAYTEQQPLTGVGMTLSAGSPVPADIRALTGVGMTASAGSLLEMVLAAPVGVSMTMQQGVLGKFFLGVWGTMQVGTLSVDLINPAFLVGVGMTLSVGSISEQHDQIVYVDGIGMTMTPGTLYESLEGRVSGVQMDTQTGDVTFVIQNLKSISSLSQQFELDDYVELYEIDATDIGGDIYRFTSSAFEDDVVYFGGNAYSPIPVESEGWEWSGRGPLPNPVLRVSNVTLAFTAAVVAFGDLLGAKVTRTRTYRRYLDGQYYADDTAYYPLDVYSIDRKRLQSKTVVEWELAAATDQQGVFLPQRPVLRNACTHRYRTNNGTDFVYTDATCPYAGTSYFDVNGNPTDAVHDRCGKKLSDCKLRFGNSPLPTRAFPGVARTQGLN